jgi:Zn finger protein HypA/HybF involved in hydrogenase expression
MKQATENTIPSESRTKIEIEKEKAERKTVHLFIEMYKYRLDYKILRKVIKGCPRCKSKYHRVKYEEDSFVKPEKKEGL